MLNVYEQIDRNKKRSFLIMVAFVVFVGFTVWILSEFFDYGPEFISLAFIISGIISFSSYYFSDKVILTLSSAKPASRKKHFNFYTVVENLSMAAQIPKPKLYVIEDSAPNAFATGRDPEHAVVCATTGLLQKLDRSELEGVIAHELSHIKYFDIRLMSLVTILIGMVTLLADWLLRSSRGRRREKASALFFTLATPPQANVV